MTMVPLWLVGDWFTIGYGSVGGGEKLATLFGGLQRELGYDVIGEALAFAAFGLLGSRGREVEEKVLDLLPAAPDEASVTGREVEKRGTLSQHVIGERLEEPQSVGFDTVRVMVTSCFGSLMRQL